MPQVRDVLAAGYGAGYGAGDSISVVFERPTAAGLDQGAQRGDKARTLPRTSLTRTLSLSLSLSLTLTLTLTLTLSLFLARTLPLTLPRPSSTGCLPSPRARTSTP